MGAAHLEHDGRRLAWQEGGDGPPLLLLQGFGGTAADWDPTFLAGLESAYRVVRPDPRGMGASSFGDPDDELSVASMADDAVRVLDALGIERTVVAGWSMGGYVAQVVTCRVPERVVGLGLVGTAPGGPEYAPCEPEVFQRLVDDRGTPREQATRLLHVLFPGAVADELDQQVGEQVAAARAVIDPAVTAAQVAALRSWHAVEPPAIPSDPPPVIAVGGSEDVVIPVANVGLLAARWAGCRPVVVDGAGHAVMAQEPELVAGLLRELA